MTKKSSRVALGATLGALALPAALLVGLPAAAHPGHDHPTPVVADESDPLDWANYERILLTKDTGEPIDLAVLPDGEVLHTARNGDVRLTDPDAGTTDVVGRFDVYANSEDGMQTIGLAPDFEESGWVYVYYAPRKMEGTATNGLPYPSTTAAGSAPTVLPPGAADATYWQQWLGYNQLSRVRYDAEARTFDMATEQVIVKVEVQRGQCCHVGGDFDFDFDAEGDVFLATGDNTPAGTPGANGYAPRDLLHGRPQPLPHGRRRRDGQRQLGRLRPRRRGGRPGPRAHGPRRVGHHRRRPARQLGVAVLHR